MTKKHTASRGLMTHEFKNSVKRRSIGRLEKKASKLKFRSFKGFLNFCELGSVRIVGELRCKGKIYANIVWDGVPKTVRIDNLPYEVK